MRTLEQVVEGLFRTGNEPPPSGQAPPRPENKRVWASLLGGKAALIQEVAQETRRRDPEGIKTRVLWVLDRAPCESCCEVSQVVKGSPERDQTQDLRGQA